MSILEPSVELLKGFGGPIFAWVTSRVEIVGTGYCGYWVQGSETLRPSTRTLSQIALFIAILGPKYCTLSQNKVNLQKYQSLWKVYVLICLPLIPCQLWLHIYGGRSDLSMCARGCTSRMQSKAQTAIEYTPIQSKTRSTTKYDYQTTVWQHCVVCLIFTLGLFWCMKVSAYVCW